MNDGRIFIKPTPQKDGEPPLKVRKPVNGHLAAEGEWVNPDSYWLRRMNDGDVVKATPPVEAQPEALVPAPAATVAKDTAKVAK